MATKEFVVGIAVMSVMLAGCGTSPAADATDRVDVERVPVAADEFFRLVWATDDELVLARREADTRQVRSWILEIADGLLREVELPEDERCASTGLRAGGGLTEYRPLSVLGDGRVVMQRSCRGSQLPPWALIAVDLRTGAVEDLASDLERRPLNSASFDPEGNIAVVSAGSDLCSGIAKLVGGQLAELPAVLEGPDGPWRVDEELLGSGECADHGRADNAEWSPTGGQIAFFASSGSGGRAGHARTAAPWNLYLMHPETLELSVLVEDLIHAHTLKWSPDGQFIAFSAGLGQRDGLYVAAVDGSGIWRVFHESPNSIAWAPSSDRLAFTLEVDNEELGLLLDEVHVAELASLLSSEAARSE